MVQSENHLYMAGGFFSVNGSGSLKNLGRFNLATETWEQVPGINRNHANFIRALSADDEGNV